MRLRLTPENVLLDITQYVTSRLVWFCKRECNKRSSYCPGENLVDLPFLRTLNFTPRILVRFPTLTAQFSEEAYVLSGKTSETGAQNATQCTLRNGLICRDFSFVWCSIRRVRSKRMSFCKSKSYALSLMCRIELRNEVRWRKVEPDRRRKLHRWTDH